MIIVMASNSGGVGKSTLSQHLAYFLATQKKAGKVGLVDADLNGTSLAWAARSDEPLPFDVALPDDIDPKDYTHLIVDTAASPGSEDLAELMSGADHLAIPTTPSPFDINPAITTATSIGISPDRYSLLLTLCPPSPSHIAGTAHETLIEAGLPVIEGWVTRRGCYWDAAVEGLTVWQLKGAAHKKAAAELDRVFRALVARINPHGK
jgi:chromosome partitioning protein